MAISLPHLLAELVRLPSINPMGRSDLPSHLAFESRVADCYERHLKSLGVPVERQAVAPGRDNVIARFPSPVSSAPTILLEAHMDTVPVDGMTIDPFGAEVRDGKLYGRGACDVKGGGVAMFGAFRRLVEERPAGAASVVLAYTVDEEHTFLGVQRLMRDRPKFDFAIVAEPTGLQIVRSHKGVARWMLETDGIACHSSRPDRGTNAIYRMARMLRAVEEYAGELAATAIDPLLGPATLSVGTIQGGVSPNTVPDACTATIDRRLLPGETPEGVLIACRAAIAARAGSEVPFRLNALYACPALAPQGGEAFVERFAEAIGDPTLLAVPYGTDASTIRDAGIPAIVFGPGQIEQAHTKDEWIELAQVDRAAEMLFAFLGRAGGITPR